ncbi:FAD-dependent oxidoreductase [Pseudooceanicola sp. 216_PA32_1]|uniref:FAD-dependent oxidoreductase n=1 Tax=Pseudooceanicola pacificus TaxID=2676438 RepID=A0A844WE03_9RHOB|nr:FAD-dependent oxidoreductase [Pseudooceanicola pacificus]MWB79813.1 FAD-dependent oxidoreductase [Pseudooceanicola pacificus]
MGRNEADFLIVGGGIAGVSAAARLAGTGRVLLLEAEDALAYHASGRSAAMFLEKYGNATVRALNEASADHHAHSDGGVLTPRAMLLVGRPGEEDAFAAEATDFGLDRIEMGQARGMVPILNPLTCNRAAMREDTYDLDTDLLIQNFLRRARAGGAEIRLKTRIDAIRFEGGRWIVRSGDEDFQAATLVNAAGAWADHVAELAGVTRLGIVPRRRSMARIPAPGGHDTRDWPFIDAVGERWYAKPDAGKLIVSPSEEDPTEAHDAWADDMVLAEGLARYEEMVTEPVTRVEHSWAGLRSFAPDRTLVIGRDPGRPEFFWLAGQGGYGFQTAPAASQLAADLLSGRPSELPANVVTALDPKRLT